MSSCTKADAAHTFADALDAFGDVPDRIGQRNCATTLRSRPPARRATVPRSRTTGTPALTLTLATTDARRAAQSTQPERCPTCRTHPQHRVTLPGLTIDRLRHEVLVSGTLLELPRKEFDLLTYLAQRPDELATKEQLYCEVWGHTTMPHGCRTVDTHISRLRTKFASVAPGVVQLQNVWGSGWRLRTICLPTATPATESPR